MNECHHGLTRRQLVAGSLLGTVATLSRAAPSAPATPVSIAKCPSYDDDVVGKLGTLFDQIGGIGGLVRGKTVTVKLNLVGNPNNRYPGYLPNVTHNVNPTVVGACCHLLAKAGASRIRLVESGGGVGVDSLEEYMLDGGWNVKALRAIASQIEFERTHNLGKGKRYSRLKVPFGGHMFPAYDLNHSYEDTDVFVTIAKLKYHATAGVSLSLKDCFGITPNSIYGDDAGVDQPNESAQQSRGTVFHKGERGPSKSAPQELHPMSPRDGGYRVPRIVVDLVAARPIDLQIIDGIESCVGGEGPWIKGSKYAHPGVLLVGRNPVCTDAVATAVMGYNPRADRGTPPFRNGDNVLKLAEAVGIGTTDLSRIDVRGVPIRNAVYDFEAQLKS